MKQLLRVYCVASEIFDRKERLGKLSILGPSASSCRPRQLDTKPRRRSSSIKTCIHLTVLYGNSNDRMFILTSLSHMFILTSLSHISLTIIIIRTLRHFKKDDSFLSHLHSSILSSFLSSHSYLYLLSPLTFKH